MPWPIAAIAGIVLTASFALQNFVPPLRRHNEQLFNQMWSNEIFAPNDAIMIRQRGYMDGEAYVKTMAKHGFSSGRATDLWLASKTQLSGEAILILNLRGELTEEQYYAAMDKIGFKRSTAEQFKLSREFYPSPNDLVSWQAREVFEADSVEKYGLEDEFDNIDKEPFYKAGMTLEQIRNFWVAHWVHPALRQVFELLHRGELTEEDVYDYYKLVEIPPYWREKLTKISYSPYTRVDVRRMYAAGVLSVEEVMQSYKDIGYDDEKAANMTDFTIASTATKERDLTRTMIEQGYETGLISPEDTVRLLMDLGYDEQESLLILGLKNYALMQDELDDKVETIKSQFRRGLVEEETAIEELDKLGLAASYRDKVVAQVQRTKQAEFKLPSKEDLLKWFDAKLLTEDEFVSYMKRLGYRETEIHIYLRSFAA